MERELYSGSFTKENVPDWICPTCERGQLKIVKNTLSCEESAESISNDPYMVKYTYACLFRCVNNKCREIVSSVGIGNIEMAPADDGVHVDYSTVFTPKYFYPNLKIIQIPRRAPGDVWEALNESFMLFFSNPSAALNRVRIAVEALLSDLGVNKKGTLQNRIDSIPAEHEDLKNLLHAARWLGNAGSHGDDVTIEDVMDAYDLMEHILTKVYESRVDAIGDYAEEINRNKGPRR